MSPLDISCRLVLLIVVQTGVAVSGEIEKLKNCGKRAMCLGKNPKNNENQFNPNLETTSPCNCDDRCADFGDCCLDMAPSPNFELTESSWACVPLGLNQSVYAVSTCSYEGVWKDQCEKNVTTDQYHYILDIAVYSNVTGLYYANIYCAFCHDQLKNVEVPRLTVKCSDGISHDQLLEIGEYQQGELVWKVGSGLCSMLLDGDGKNGRSCVQYVSSCPPGTNPQLSAKCNAYAMVLSSADKMYRNPHCALCNGAELRDLRCWYGFEYRIFPPLAMIIGFDWNFDSCGVPERVWDGLHQRCTSTGCSSYASCSTNVSANEINDVGGSPCYTVEASLNLRIDGYITFICMTASVVSLGLHMIVNTILPHPQTVPTKVLNSLAGSLLAAQLLFLFGMSPLFGVPLDICRLIAILVQYFYLASFFWMNAMSIDIYTTFSKDSLTKKRTKSHTKYSFYAWGGAMLVTAVSALADTTDWLPEDYRPYYAAKNNFCWFGNPIALAIFFYFPTFFLVILNTALFGVTVCWFQKQHVNSETLKTSGRKEYNRLWLYIKLSTIMGTSWVFGLVTSITKMPIYRYPFTILNGLQGVFIFIMFDLKSEVVSKILKQIQFRQVRKSSTNKGESQFSGTSKVTGKTWI